jgi:hypothetical protein
MAGQRLDAMVVREGKDGKKYWTKIGAAFPNDKGGYNVTLDALPVGGQLFLYPPRERTQGGGQTQQQSTPAADPQRDNDIPF